MRHLLGIIGLLAFVASLGMCAISKSAMQETTAAVCVLIGVVAIGLAGVIEVLQDLRRDLKRPGA